MKNDYHYHTTTSLIAIFADNVSLTNSSEHESVSKKQSIKSYMQSSPHQRAQPRSPSPSPSGTPALDSGSAHSRYRGGGSPACRSRQGGCSPLPQQHLQGMTKNTSSNEFHYYMRHTLNLLLSLLPKIENTPCDFKAY